MLNYRFIKTKSAFSERSIGSAISEMITRMNAFGGVVLVFLFVPFLMVLSRNVASPVLAVAVCVLVFEAWRANGAGVIRQASDAFGACRASQMSLGLFLYIALTLLWTPALTRGFETTAHLGGSVLSFWLAVFSLSRCPDDVRSQRGLPSLVFSIALALAALLIIVELSFGAPVRTFLGGTGEAFRMNRAAVAIVLFLPLSLVLLSGVRQGRALGLGIVCLVGVACFQSESETAKLIYLLQIVLFPAFLLAKRRAGWALGLLFLASLWLMPLIADHILPLLPSFVQERMSYGTLGIRADMWSAFSSLIRNAPVLGHGVEASFVAAKTYPDTPFDSSLLDWGHPHNFSIQVWYELGLVGVALFSGLIVSFFSALKHVPDRFLPAILVTAASVWTVCLVSHGAWQAWWWCLVAILVLLWLIEIRAARKEFDRKGDWSSTDGTDLGNVWNR